MSSESPALALDIRLRALEAQLFGTPTTLLDPPSTPSDNIDTKPAARRVWDIKEGLERLGDSSEGIQRLIDGYNQYLPLLSIPALTTSANAPLTNTENQIKESDLLPDSVKLSMILEAANDIRSAERDLREIELLKGGGAEGSGELEELIPLRPALIDMVQQRERDDSNISQARESVGQLLMRYTDFTSTVSELFVDLHHQMEALEDGLARVKRKQRKEIASRF